MALVLEGCAVTITAMDTQPTSAKSDQLLLAESERDFFIHFKAALQSFALSVNH